MKIKSTHILMFLIFFMFFFPLFAFSQNGPDDGKSSIKNKTKPLWEIGLLTTALRLPHYRGSDEYNIYALPLPYVIYRGKYFQSDRDGFRGIFSKTKNLEANLSFYGNPPVNDDNNAREGMEELDPVIEAGPALKWFFMGRHPVKRLYLKPIFRVVSSINFSKGMDFDYQGFKTGLSLIYKDNDLLNNDLWRFGVKLGMDFTNKKYNSYFYDVSREYVNGKRDYYSSNSGYAGFIAAAFLVRKITKNLSLWSYMGWNNINGAVYEDSPLVRQKNNLSVGASLIWIFSRSKRQVSTKYLDEEL